MLWINFGNRPASNPYPACAACQRPGGVQPEELGFDYMFRADNHAAPEEG